MSLISEVAVESTTPMMKQYLDIKKQNKDYVLFFRLGEFYEMFYDDALEVSRFLELTLTARGHKDNKIPMCGIPYHAAENYIVRLIKGGYKIAICEQVEDPSQTKGIVKRKVVRYYTPGTLLSDQMLDAKNSHYLVACVEGKQRRALSFVDLSTGEFKTIEFVQAADMLNELERLAPKEVLYSEAETLSSAIQHWAKRTGVLLSPFDDWAFSLGTAQQTLQQFFQTQSLEGFGLKDLKEAIQSSGAVIHYLKQMHGDQLGHIRKIQRYSCEEFMVLDVATQRNLELVQSLLGKDNKGTLLSVMDYTFTSAGGRLLRQWMLQPLRNPELINQRLNAVEELYQQEPLRRSLRDLFKSVHDVQRIVGRVDTAVANARDLVALKETLHKIPVIQDLMAQVQSPLLSQLKNELQTLPELQACLETTLVNEPPFSVREGGLIRTGYNEEIDELRAVKNGGKEWLIHLQEDERRKTGIKTLKVKYNKVFGYYLEVTKSQIASVPDHYIRKQTMVNAERFITPELKEKEALILGADDRIHKMEYQLFEQLRLRVAQDTPRLQQLAQALAVLDVLQSFAELASSQAYCKPEVNLTDKLNIEGGRHPVVETLLEGERFVPNDTHLSCDVNQLMMITGPNMAGKSTCIRQVALITYMAQLGSFVPAERAEIGIVDRIFTRVGAADELARGQSTFMLEMNEIANILNNATSQSLIILDEVGRGTSTLDGVSIAWAIAEYVHEVIKAKTIFATHYHELTALADHYERIVNYNVACQENAGDVVFLHRIVAGGTDKSYGIHVARLAGVPQMIVRRAKDLLKDMEAQHEQVKPSMEHVPSVQEEFPIDLDVQEASANVQEVIDRLKDMDCSSLRPIEALMVLDELVQKVKI